MEEGIIKTAPDIEKEHIKRIMRNSKCMILCSLIRSESLYIKSYDGRGG
jgi:hypothetical protein